MSFYRSSIISQIIKYNRRLAKSIICEDDSQIITLTAFVNQCLWCHKRVSVSAILLTTDNKILVCNRRDSFLYSEIIRTRNMYRKKRLFLNYSNYLNKQERSILSSFFSLDPATADNDRINAIYPGGIPKRGENVPECLSREIKEEVNIDNSFVFIDTRFFIHGIIEDTIINKFFEVIFFVGRISLTSDQIIDTFKSNHEIKDLIFLDPNSGNGLQYEIAKYALDTAKLKCYGHRGCYYESLKKLTEDD
ncbi:MutT motif protein [Monkeypox virus]|uniref:mRNA-decapping protein OPG122 n=3 Tax=Monkeypox virus TaxID=10244 RepID=PG122_MONPV|nr:MutT motif protein [Monkeypox virus]YP_010377104.1 MutT motif protein [Monkeypox virus]A0A7H0DN94.1 RecName: Full=mRNA-decapping protein OPG122 [Monkeypox virus]AAL40565.1 E10R [Monkeypox virus Zaire-96-I-16]AAU01311.1 MPXV-WRAIR101 [Monkeypox virus]AAW67859.1 MPXV-SL-101 [Monkeypox virus]AAX09202.1 MPXV-COP-101 [Monkeypox virus]AAY96906.1 unknown [Monkeypox virus]